MNERIKELAEQALQLVADEHTDGDESRLNTDSYHVKDLIQEKFAELIIQECLQQCEQIRDDAYTQKKSEFLTESGRLIYEGVFGGATNCGFAIQQHFGVEL